MNESEIRSAVKEVIAGILALPSDQIASDANFYDELGGDSMQKLEVIAHIEARFNCRLTDVQAAEGDTVEELTHQVAQHVS